MRPTILIVAMIAGLLAVAPSANTTGGDGQASDTRYEKATFAGGCFWCMEPPFDELPGVVSTTSGYTGGHTKNPTYEDVSAGGTGHAEAVEVVRGVRERPSGVVFLGGAVPAAAHLSKNT